ncbi:MAG: metal ABC transporter permease [Turicibacter sp.]|nr:metal ABC transporter permease [Turicibacter sp.]
MAILLDHTFQIVALGSGMLGLISGVLGTFAVLRKESLLGEGVSHSALPGVVLAFLLTGVRQTEVLLLGAAATGLLAVFFITLIVKYSKLKFDSALALIMSVFFGFGLLLLTHAQRIPTASQAGLSRFIYGQAAALLGRDIHLLLWVSGGILLLVFLFWKEFKVFSFDPEYARVIGIPTVRIHVLLSLLIVTAIIVGLQTVGVVLMSSMLIAPAVAARQWTNRLGTMTLLAALFGIISGVVGTFLSSTLERMPTGPAIVVIATSIALISLLVSPNRGILQGLLKRSRLRKEGI